MDGPAWRRSALCCLLAGACPHAASKGGGAPIPPRAVTTVRARPAPSASQIGSGSKARHGVEPADNSTTAALAAALFPWMGVTTVHARLVPPASQGASDSVTRPAVRHVDNSAMAAPVAVHRNGGRDGAARAAMDAMTARAANAARAWADAADVADAVDAVCVADAVADAASVAPVRWRFPTSIRSAP